jgi:hypothetical protein
LLRQLSGSVVLAVMTRREISSMAPITWTDVTGTLPADPGIAPELVTVGVPLQDVILAYVNERVNPSVHDGEEGNTTKTVRSYLAAHLATMTLRGNNNESGTVVSESLGPQSRSYAVTQADLSDSILKSTQYGQVYLFMVRSSPKARMPRTLW